MGNLSRGYSNGLLVAATVKAMKEKLKENEFKGPITDLTLPEALQYMKAEIAELSEELMKDKLDYEAIRRELADIINFSGAAIVDCDRMVVKKRIHG